MDNKDKKKGRIVSIIVVILLYLFYQKDGFNVEIPTVSAKKVTDTTTSSKEDITSDNYFENENVTTDSCII